MPASGLVRADSGAYWDADGWDPDDRVYVGASTGETSHRVAVQPDAGTENPTAAEEPDSIRRSDSIDFWDTMQASTPTVGGKVSSQVVPAGSAEAGPGVRFGGSSTSMGLAQTTSGGSFWDRQMGMGDAGHQGGTGTFGAARPGQPVGKEADGKAEEKGEEGGEQANQQASRRAIQRVDSRQYWDAGGWDPDERVYVGAGAGQTNHLTAVDLNAQEQADLVWRVWTGGLASTALGLGHEAGPPIDVSRLPDGAPKLNGLYDVGETLGVGSFGSVRSGMHRATGRKCAVKALGKLASGERYRRNLVDDQLGERLLRMTLEVPHENVAHYLDMLEGPNHWYVVMEELSGRELLQQLEEHFPVTEAYLQQIMLQVLRSLEHIHGASVGMIHRDVKLSNYRFRNPGPDAQLVLLDFGFACSVDREWDKAHCGTLMFMAPEVVGSSAAVPNLAGVDLWAAGVILYVLLTGDSPVQEGEVKLFSEPGTAPQAAEVLAKALHAEELTLASSEVVDLLNQLLVIDPAKRVTAEKALEHQWFVTKQSERRLSVSSDAIGRMRSFSSTKKSTRSFANAKLRSSKKTADTDDFPDIDDSLERIVSGDAEELVDLNQDGGGKSA